MKKAKNTLWIAGCFLLVGVNVAFFLLFPRLVSGIAIVLSNVITLLLTFLAFKPINDWLQADLVERQQELIAKLEKDRELEKKVDALELENRELTNRLDTRSQTVTLPTHIDYTFKVEQMQYAKQGYVVKEEELDGLDSEKFDIPGRKFLDVLLEDSMLRDAAVRKILYIHKFYYKVSLGIDFSKMMYAIDEGRLLFYGARFEKLHDISSELQPETGDIDRCDILKITGDKAELRQDKEFDGLKAQYRQAQAQEVKSGMEEEVGALCSQYTAALHESIKGRFGDRVDFVDSIEEYRDKNWYALKSSDDPTVQEVAANMLMLTTVMNRTQAIGEEAGVRLLEEA
ncbi:MAG: hypothetical protein IJ156_08430 [Bacteroidales bacterium]|nr:hypothetical protein [Bacteroidales bacterium]